MCCILIVSTLPLPLSFLPDALHRPLPPNLTPTPHATGAYYQPGATPFTKNDCPSPSSHQLWMVPPMGRLLLTLHLMPGLLLCRSWAAKHTQLLWVYECSYLCPEKWLTYSYFPVFHSWLVSLAAHLFFLLPDFAWVVWWLFSFLPRHPHMFLTVLCQAY